MLLFFLLFNGPLKYLTSKCASFFFFGWGKKELKSLVPCDGDDHDSFAEDVAFCVCFTLCNSALLFHHFNSGFVLVWFLHLL